MTDPDYPFALRPLAPDEGGGWLIEFPDLPGCMSDGETPEEALENGRDAVRSWIESARMHGDPIPLPSASAGPWPKSISETLRRRLADRAQRDGVSIESLLAALISEGLAVREGSRRP